MTKKELETLKYQITALRNNLKIFLPKHAVHNLNQLEFVLKNSERLSEQQEMILKNIIKIAKEKIAFLEQVKSDLIITSNELMSLSDLL